MINVTLPDGFDYLVEPVPFAELREPYFIEETPHLRYAFRAERVLTKAKGIIYAAQHNAPGKGCFEMAESARPLYPTLRTKAYYAELEEDLRKQEFERFDFINWSTFTDYKRSI